MNMRMSSHQVHVELAINFNDPKDLTKVKEIIQDEGLKLVSSSFVDKKVHIVIDVEDSPDVVRGTRSTTTSRTDIKGLQRSIEQHTGLLVVVKGLGNSQAAVAELSPPSSGTSKVFGVVRLSQLDNGICYADGSIEGHVESPNEDCSSSHKVEYQFDISIHEFGDLTGDNFDSIGEVLVTLSRGSCQVDHNRTLDITFRKLIPNCNLREMTGRSVALIVKDPMSVANGSVVSAAVLARASEISNNDKKVCACSGKTIWEERRENSRTVYSDMSGHNEW